MKDCRYDLETIEERSRSDRQTVEGFEGQQPTVVEEQLRTK